MSLPLALYIVFGPLVWAGMFVAYSMARAKMNRLTRARQLPGQIPHVAILIPAKDEAAGIARCVASALSQDYPSFEVLAIDDRSKDATGEILDSLAREQSNLHVLHIEKTALPDGWLGKCHALAKGAEWVERSGRAPEWILFVDSDVTLQPNALTFALSNVIERKYDALSVLTRLECHSFLERLVLPLAGAAWSIMFAVARTNDDDVKTSAAANGQFFLIRRSAYETVGGHAAVRDQITEDVELMRRLKMADFRTRICFGHHLAATRMHATFRQMIHGWGRIFSGSSRRHMMPIIGGMLFIIIAGFSLWPAMIYGIARSHVWLIAAIVHWVLMTAYAGLVYFLTGQPRRNAIWFPLGQGVLLVLFGYALRMCQTGRVFWRDTHYAAWTPATATAGRSAQDSPATANRADVRIDGPIPRE